MKYYIFSCHYLVFPVNLDIGRQKVRYHNTIKNDPVNYLEYEQ